MTTVNILSIDLVKRKNKPDYYQLHYAANCLELFDTLDELLAALPNIAIFTDSILKLELKEARQ